MPATVAGFVDAPPDIACLGITQNLDAAPFRPETSGVMKGADQLAGLTTVAAVHTAHDSAHKIVSSMDKYLPLAGSFSSPIFIVHS